MEWLLWLIFWASIPALLWFDFKGSVESLKVNLFYFLGYMAVAGLFGYGIYVLMSPDDALLYFTVYTLEKTLSVDNLFVISQVLALLAIPLIYQHKVLLWGVLGAIVFRAIFISLGSGLVHMFEPILLLFAAFLVYVGLTNIFSGGDDKKLTDRKWYVWITKNLPFTKKLHGDKFLIKKEILSDEKFTTKFFWVGTPVLLAVFAVEIVDLIFAVDSIPAALAVTTKFCLVFWANIYAVLGLRRLYFIVAEVISKFELMEKVVGLLLVLIGVKVFYSFFVVTEYGVSLGLEKISATTSLIVTLSILFGGFFISWIYAKYYAKTL